MTTSGLASTPTIRLVRKVQNERNGRARNRIAVAVVRCATLAMLPVANAWAGGGPFGIDHVVPYDDSGIWARSHQINLAVGTALVVVGGAVWFGDDNKMGDTFWRSFDAMEIASAVMPMMIAYGPDHPWVYGLAVLPVYDAIARVKVHGHWQSDVLIGGAIGVGFGVYASQREAPFIVGLLPRGLTIGISKRF